MRDTRVTVGAVLIALGVVFLLGVQLGVGGEGVVAAIGLGLLVAYVLTRHYGFLVPGGIMTGLGVGIVVQTRSQGQGSPVLLGLGLGFLAIYVLGASRRKAAQGWWPLIPGGVLTAIGLLRAAGGERLVGTIARWWPAALIAVGVYLLLRPHRRISSTQP